MIKYIRKPSIHTRHAGEVIMEKIVQKAYYSNEVLNQISQHYHDYHQIILILNGTLQVFQNGMQYEAGPGHIVLFSCYENHSIKSLPAYYERYVLHISPSADSSKNRLYSLLSNRPSGFHNIIDISSQLGDFERIFAQITGEYHSKEQLSDDMQALLVNELLIKIYRRLPELSHFLEAENFEMISELQRRFETHYEEAYTLEELSREYNVSVSLLSHQFKKLTGSSVMGYLLSCRMAAAKNLLAQTTLSIGAIVDKCGFSDSSNFSRTFKQMNGISPSDFRKQVNS